MKTYILRNPHAVETQIKSTPGPIDPDPAAAPARLVAPPLPASRFLFIGLDVHNDSIAVSLAPSDSTEVRRYGIIGGSHDDVLKLIKKLQAAHPDVELKFCYEAGPLSSLSLHPQPRSLLHHRGPFQSPPQTGRPRQNRSSRRRQGGALTQCASRQALWVQAPPAPIPRTKPCAISCAAATKSSDTNTAPVSN